MSTVSGLTTHPIFASSSKSPKLEQEWEVVGRPNDLDIKPKQNRLVVRDKELIVAVGNEVRIASILQKDDKGSASYSTLSSPHLDFLIQSLILNPTQCLLAVVGQKQLVILVLPKSPSSKTSSISCVSIIIDDFQFSPSSLVDIAKVIWHPLGQGGESLWVMTTDGILREYDIQSPMDPVQTYNFLPTLASSSKYTAIDPFAQYATSFSFGPSSEAGWGELAVYGLMANGDIYTLCPILPLRSSVSLLYLQRLKAYVSHSNDNLAKEWVESLIRQSRIGKEVVQDKPSKRMSILGRSTRGTSTPKKEEVDPNEMINLHPPHLTSSGGPAPGYHHEIERQNPMVLDPAPLGGDEEDVANDLMVFDPLRSSLDGEERVSTGMIVVGIAWSSGRLDLGLMIEPAEARWVMNKRIPEDSRLPILESIEYTAKPTASDSTSLFQDPVYGDTLYVQHASGVHSICLSSWTRALSAGRIDGFQSEVFKVVKSQPTNPIEGMTTFCNMSLGYGLIAMSSSGQVAALESEYRNTKVSKLDTSPRTPQTDATDKQSLITPQPLNIEKLISSLRPTLSLSNARKALSNLPSFRQPIDQIGPEQLRALGDLVSQLYQRIEAVRAASQVVEHHLDIQTQEYQRQLNLLKLSKKGVERVQKYDPIPRSDELFHEQKKLTERVKKLMAQMSGEFSPPVSEKEKKWFGELEGIRGKVEGGKGFGVGRGSTFQSRLDELRDRIDGISEQLKKDGGVRHQSRIQGTSKEFKPLANALNRRYEEIQNLMNKMDNLSVQLKRDDEGDIVRKAETPSRLKLLPIFVQILRAFSMLAEVLLVLAGHPSSFFPSSSSSQSSHAKIKVSSSLTEYLHPGEVSSLEYLAAIAQQYTRIRQWARTIQDQTRKTIISEATKKGKGKPTDAEGAGSPGVYLSTLANGLLDILKEYDLLLVEVETRILAVDPTFVQDGSSYVPLSTLVATFDPWQPVLQSLSYLISTLSQKPSDGDVWTPGKITQLVRELSDTGDPRLKEIYVTLSKKLFNLFIIQLIAFLLYGSTSTQSSSISPSLGIDTGHDPLNPSQRLYKLNEDLLPPSVSTSTRQSILYIGRITATLKREGRKLPTGLVDRCTKELTELQDPGDGPKLDASIFLIRQDVGEWLWKNILTGHQVKTALQAYADYFLLLKPDFAVSLIRECHSLYRTKLLEFNPSSSSSVIRETDLNRAILRASLGTMAESDPLLEKLNFKLEQGPIKTIASTSAARRITHKDGISENERPIFDMFGSSVFGVPLDLKIKIGWPLDIFITPQSAQAYSDIHSYLFALRECQIGLIDCFMSMTTARRRRERKEINQSEEDLERASWGLMKVMLFFMDQLIAHFHLDIIETQFYRLMEEIESVGLEPARRRIDSGLSTSRSVGTFTGPRRSTSRADLRSRGGTGLKGDQTPLSEEDTIKSKIPPTPGKTPPTFMDFLKLRQLNARHLTLIREGLLLTDKALIEIIRDTLFTCKRFVGLIERWNHNPLPEMLTDNYENIVAKRTTAVQQLSKSFSSQMQDFFAGLLETQNPLMSKDDASSNGTAGTSFSKTARTIQMSRMMSRQASFSLSNKGADGSASKTGGKAEKTFDSDAMMGRHVEQLILRLDYNSVLSSWVEKEDGGMKSENILAEGGL